MTPEESKAIVNRIYSQMDEEKTMAALLASAAPDYVVHFPGMPPADAATMGAIAGGFFAAFPDLTHTLHDVIAEGEMVAFRLTLNGTQKRPFVTPAGELPATGKSVELSVLNMMRLQDGKVAEHWIEFDSASLMQQLGAGG